MEFAVALAPVFALWAVAAAVAAIRTSRADLGASAWRGLVAAGVCALMATFGLIIALVEGDVAVGFVAQSSSVLMPARYIPAALLSAPGGALLALAACTGLAGTLVTRTLRGAARSWAIATIGGAIAVSLAVVAIADAPFALVAVRTDGAGLSSDLQRGAAVLHAVALLVATVCATASFAEMIAAVATQGLDDAWSRRVRRWNAAAWTALFVGVIAGARWYALNPVRGLWLEAPSTALWLLPCVAGAWLVHLDTSALGAARVATRLVLTSGIFVAMMISVAFLNGAFVNGVARAGAGYEGALVGAVPALAITVFIGRLRRGAGVLRAVSSLTPPTRSPMGAWIAHAGFILLIVAMGGSGFTREHTVTLSDAEIFRAKDPFGHQWQFSSQGLSTLQRENYASLTVSLMPTRDARLLPMLSAETRSYGLADGAASGLPAFITGTAASAFMETRLTITAPDGRRPTLQVAFVPLATWVVVGAWLVAIGTLLPLATDFGSRIEGSP